jgi:hypothetical protein
MVSFTLQPLYPWGKELPVPIGQKIGWVSEPVWTKTNENIGNVTERSEDRKKEDSEIK